MTPSALAERLAVLRKHPFWRSRYSGHACAALIVVAVAVLLSPITPLLTVNDGLGYDGKDYAAMVQAFRGEPHGPVLELHAYRFAPTGLVALTGLELKSAFLWLGLLATFGSGALFFALLRRFGAPLGLALVGVLWWSALPQGLRWVMHYPVQVDAMGFLLLLGLLHTALAGRFTAFAALLVVSAVTREQLFALVPFLFLHNTSVGIRAALVRTALATLPALAVYAAAHVAPPIRLETVPPSAAAIFWQTVALLPDAWRRLLATIPLALGLFALLPFTGGRAAVEFLRRSPAWTYYLIATFLVAVLAGSDPDHNLYALSPLAGILVFGRTGARSGVSWVTLPALTLIHSALSRAFIPLGPDEASYLSEGASTMDRASLLGLTAFNAGLLVLAISIVWWWRAHGPVARAH